VISTKVSVRLTLKVDSRIPAGDYRYYWDLLSVSRTQ